MLGVADLVFEDGVKAYLDSRKSIVEKSNDVFLFGTARGGRRVFELLKKWGLDDRIRYVVDNDPMKHGKMFQGREIISAAKMISLFWEYEQAIILIASGSAHIIINQLVDMGISREKLIPFVITNLQLSPTPYQYFSQNVGHIKKVYDLLADEESKNTWIALINYKMTQDCKWLKGISHCEREQYFDPIMNYSDKESFVDCGAYIGDTLDEYNNSLNGKWDNYYCFEADKDVFFELEKYVNSKNLQRVELINVGCWNKRDELFFETAGSGSSTIVKNGKGIKILADSLDNILKDKNITVIKMDIEGAERYALQGASNIIENQHPKMAISIYHSLEDFIQIPLILNEYGRGYKLFIRHYREITDSETVCYAI